MNLVPFDHRPQAAAGLDFASLVKQHESMALGYAASILHDPDLAQDAVQEALAVALVQLPKLRDAEAFASWLRGIVRYQCYRLFRSRRLATVPLEAATVLADGALEAPPPAWSGPDRPRAARLRQPLCL